MPIDLTELEDIVNKGESVAATLGPLLMFIPVLGPYAGAIVAAIPNIIKATHQVEDALGLPVDSVENEQTIANALDPAKPDVIPSAPKTAG